MNTLLLNKWLHVPVTIAAPKMRLICFPYAGASGVVYHPWAKLMPEGVELSGVQMAGRLARRDEPPMTRLEPLIDILAEVVASRPDVPVVFFGHSMGAILAFELMHRLARAGEALPRHLIVSGHCAPQLPNKNRDVYRLTEGEFIERVKRFNGTPPALLADRELLEMILPSLRADFEILGTRTDLQRAPLDVPITAMAGRQDSEATPAQVSGWSTHTAAGFNQHLFDGGHFFINENRDDVLTVVRKICRQVMAQQELSPV